MPRLSPERSAELSRLLGRALEAVYARTPDEPLETLVDAYREVESRFRPELRDEPELELEARRRVAELTLYSAIEKDAPFETAARFYEAVADLGFDPLERRATIGIIYARYCYDVDRPGAAAELLVPLRQTLREALAAEESPLYRDLLGTVESLLVNSGAG